MSDKKYYVYLHKTPSNKYYIGITGQSDINLRWKNGLGYVGNSYFYRAIKKYGWDNIEHVILHSGLDFQSACDKEKELIVKYSSNNRKHGYNIASGGNVNYPTVETVEKLRLARLGSKHSEDTKRKMSLAKKGEKSIYFGKYGKDSMHSKKIDQYDINHNYIQTWHSTMDIERELGLHHVAISHVCTGRANSAGGFYWAYHGNKPLFQKSKKLRPVKQINPKTNEVIDTFQSIAEITRKLKVSSGGIVSVCSGARKTCAGFRWEYA